MSTSSYTRLELRRTFRNRRMLMFSVLFPIILYVVLAAPQKDDGDFGGSGISAPLYYMVGLASFGTMMAMVTSGARIAGERTSGWTRQLRISPLSVGAYFRAKVLTAYALACSTMVILALCGVALGVRLDAGDWLAMAGLILVGLLPFAALGVLLGHLLDVDAMGPAAGGVVSLLALVSGTWFPIPDTGVLHTIAVVLPSYWLVQASHVGISGSGWSEEGWIVVAAWTLVLTGLARWAYRRDTGRV